MPSNKRAPFPEAGVVGRRGVHTLIHVITTGSSGAISSQDNEVDSGVVAAKVGSTNGRYTLTVLGGKPCRKFLGGRVTVIGPNTAAFTAAAGNDAKFRANDIDGNNLDGTIELQMISSDGNAADAEPTSGSVLIVELKVAI